MSLSCAAKHLCGMTGIAIKVKPSHQKKNCSSNAPVETKHFCENCRGPVHVIKERYNPIHAGGEEVIIVHEHERDGVADEPADSLE